MYRAYKSNPFIMISEQINATDAFKESLGVNLSKAMMKTMLMPAKCTMG